jgi:carbon storage regulator
MLVLSRYRDEGIWIGKDIRIVICDVRKGKVRVGIECPSDVLVLRDEVKEKIESEQEN